MTYKQVFLIEGKLCGVAERESVFLRGELQPPESLAYFCPHPDCGRVWARAAVAGRPHFVYSMTCGRHQSPWRHQIWGSVWLNWDAAFNDGLPREVLLREFRLAEAHWRKHGGE